MIKSGKKIVAVVCSLAMAVSCTAFAFAQSYPYSLSGTSYDNGKSVQLNTAVKNYDFTMTGPGTGSTELQLWEDRPIIQGNFHWGSDQTFIVSNGNHRAWWYGYQGNTSYYHIFANFYGANGNTIGLSGRFHNTGS